MINNVFNISLTNNFHAFLANKFALKYKDCPLELSDVLFLVPSKRAAQSLREAFLQVFDLKPMILPQIKAISDFDEGELSLRVDDFSKISPSISKYERLFFFIKMILSKHGVSLEQAYFLAQELAQLLDEATNLGVDLNNLAKIVPDNFSAHVQETFEFLRIITKNWPEILQEQGLVDVAFRNNQILSMVAKNLMQLKQKVVVAGVAAPFLGIKEIVKSVFEMQDGEVYFYGTDMELSDDEFSQITDIHPSFENKQMLGFLGLKRDEIINITKDKIKEKFISELMRPANSTENWQNIDKTLGRALENINIIQADNMSQEALIISLLIRKYLDDNKQIALITPDRQLSRRVCVELKRFGLEVDDSAGRPLSSSALGSFLRLVLESVLNQCDVISFLSLVKHPYFKDKDFVKEYEKIVLRQKKENVELSKQAQEIKDKIILPQQASLKEFIEAHIKLAQCFCDKLFVKEEGRVAAQLLSDVMENCTLIEKVSIQEYNDFFQSLLSSSMVRKNYNTNPKIKILGPIEARFTKFDVAILGSCNEGVWPLNNGSNPWLSDGMKKDLGLTTSAYKTGIAAFDFASSLCADKVYITRALKVDGTPQSKSRFLLKIEALIKVLNYKVDIREEYIYKKLCDIINQPKDFINLAPPAPTPPLYARPKEISASQIETWMKDPYSIFAKYILSLYPLDDLNQELDARDYGTLIHKILELFYKKFDGIFPLNAKEELQTIGSEVFDKAGLKPEVLIFWQARLNKIIDWIIEIENSYCVDIKKRYAEISYSIMLDDFVLKAKADRVDEMVNGDIKIVDYKTGGIKSKKEMLSGYAPQLPAEGLIFAEKMNADVASLIYWQLGKKEAVFDENLDELLLKTKERLSLLIKAFRDENTAYHAVPNSYNAPKYSDYEHLSRLKEWSVKGGEDD